MKKFYLACLAALTAFAVYAQDTWPQITRVASNGDEGSQYYRIPAIETCADGSLVAIFDQRGSSIDDLPNNISIVARRSTDNGQTWGPYQVLAQTDNSTKKYGDPLVIRDRESGTLICLFVGDYGFFTSSVLGQSVPRIYMTRSRDNGQTWEEVTCIHDQIYDKTNWYAAFAASGKMCQLSDGTICAMVNARMGSSSSSKVHEYVIYTNDCGDTWHTRSGNACTGIYNGNEAKLVELYDGTLLMSMRAVGHRVFNKSYDKGETWGPAYMVPELVEPGCNGDIIRYEYGGKQLLLHSIPNNASSRQNVSVFVSEDNGKTWPIRRTLLSGASAYSSLTVLQDGTIGCLLEEGDNPPVGMRIDFYRFSLEWLLEGENTTADPRTLGYLDLDGSRYMSIDKDEAFSFNGNNPITMTFKAKTSAFTSSYPRLVCNRTYEGTNKNYVSGFDWFMGSSSNQAFANNVNVNTNGASWSNIGSTYLSGYTPGQWAHLAWTYDGTNQKVFLNASTTTSSTNTTNYRNVDCLGDILVGAGYNTGDGLASLQTAGSFKFTGQIDELRFYKGILTDAEIQQDMNSDTPLAGKELIAAYDFSNIQGNTVPDISGNGHVGTLINFPASSGYIMTQTQNSSVMGTYTLTAADGATIANGETAELGAELTINCTPTEWNHVAAVWVNAEQQDVQNDAVTFTVQGHTTIYVEFERDADAPLDYCFPTSVIGRTDRQVTGFTVTDNEGSTATVGALTPANGNPIYVDNTATVFNTKAGNTVTFTLTNAAGEWMHSYMYIDFGKDGVFDVDATIAAANGDLVGFDRYSPAGTYYDSAGNTYSDGHTYLANRPSFSFTIPSDLATGDYRARYKCDWNSTDPCGTSSIADNGGAVVDFTIHVQNDNQGTSIENAVIDPANGPIEYYNLQGARVSGDNLVPGFYILRQGSVVKKVFIGK